MRKVFIALLCVFCLVLAGGARAEEQVEPPIEKIAKDIHFQISSYNADVGTVYFRGKLMGWDLIMQIATSVYETEGMVSVTPAPYMLHVSKSPLYSWDEIFKEVLDRIANVVAEHRKETKEKAAPKTGL